MSTDITVTDAEVDAGARSLYAQMGMRNAKGDRIPMTPYDELTERSRANWLKWARATLTGARAMTHAAVRTDESEAA